MDLKSQLQSDMKTAMKAGEATRLGVVRMLISEVKKREIDNKTTLDDAGIQKVISSFIKQRTDSLDAFVKGGREDLAAKEREEIQLLKAYLPAQLSQAEVEALVAQAIAESGAASPNDIGKVMKIALAKSQGKADGKLVNEIARAKLSPK